MSLIKKSCRICAGSRSLVNIVGNEELTKILRISANIQIKPDDKLPKQICKQCKNGLEFAYNLRNLGQANEKKFRSEIEQMEVNENDSDSLEVPGDSTDIEEEEDDDFEEPPQKVLSLEIAKIEENDYEEYEALEDLEEIDEEKSEYTDKEEEELDGFKDDEIPDTDEEYENEDFDGHDPDDEDYILEDEEDNVLNDSDDGDCEETSYDPLNVRNKNAGGVERSLYMESSEGKEQKPTTDDDLIYNGVFSQRLILAFHKKHSTLPTTWEPLTKQIHEGDKRYECLECGIKYSARKYFIDHVLIHTGEKTFKCRLPKCDQIYKNWEGLRRHLLRHIERRMIGCSKCKQRFKDKDDFYYHKKVHKCRGELRKVFGVETQYSSKRDSDDDEDDGKPEIRDEDIVYNGEMKMLEIVEFHKKHSKKSVTWTSELIRIQEGKYKYQCKTCGMKYRAHKNFVNHALIHTGERPYKCRVAECDGAFRNWKALETHLANHYDERSLVCDICGHAFKHKHSYLNHISDIHKRQRYKKSKPQILEREQTDDEEDDKVVYEGDLNIKDVLEFHRQNSERPTSWRELLETIQNDESGYKIKCKSCGEKFRKNEYFINHALKHTGEKTYKCRLPKCRKAYISFTGLKIHLLVHLGGPTYTCDTCGATFKNSTSIYRHTRTHSVVSTFTIEGKSGNAEVFENEDPYLEDLIDFHRYQKAESKCTEEYTEILNEGAERFRCTECGEKNTKLKMHIAHVVTHTGERPFKCKALGCIGSFVSWEALKDHLVVHYKGKKFICEICGKKFDTKRLFTKHIANHRRYEDQAFKCQYCDAVFKKRFKVVNHEKLHRNPGNERLLKCEFCDKKFLNGNARKFHKIAEHGVEVLPWKEKKPDFFTCVKCFSSFNDPALFREHKEECSFVVNENFKCRFCSQKFQEQFAYQEHEENFHNDKWKLLLIDEMESIYNEFEEAEESSSSPGKLPSALELAQKILDDATPHWKKS